MHPSPYTHSSAPSVHQESSVKELPKTENAPGAPESTHREHTPAFHQPSPGQTRPPTLFVIFGAQGDLTKRKLIPALYNLAASRHLPQEFAILGVDGVSMTTEDFRLKISRDLQELSTRPIDSTIKEW